MANRGLSDEEVALAKGMISLGMQRDVIHSFFVSPGNPLTPAFVSELSSGKIGRDIPQASQSETIAFINSRMAFRTTVPRRSQDQLELFPAPPNNILSPHKFSWINSKLVSDRFVDYTARSNKEYENLLNEARFEIGTLKDDSALGNHPRLKRRVENLLAALPEDIAYLDPVLAGARAKKIMQNLSISNVVFSDEFIGEVTASISSVFMLVSHFEQWRRFELMSAATELRDQSQFTSHAQELSAAILRLPRDLVEEKVGLNLREFLNDSEDFIPGTKNTDAVGIEVSASLNASINYSALSTISQFAAILVKEVRTAGRQAGHTAKNLISAIQNGSIEGVQSSTKILTSSLILLYTTTQLRALSQSSPEILGWLGPFLDMLDRILAED